ncbi:Uncharacterised protein [uncultured archaeon]|nr:Uncharacterised protein [uncultured archaeon]
MVRKEVSLLIGFSLVLVLTFSLLSAGIFSDLYSGMTGHSITGNAVMIAATCTETDGGNDPTHGGTTTFGYSSGPAVNTAVGQVGNIQDATNTVNVGGQTLNPGEVGQLTANVDDTLVVDKDQLVVGGPNVEETVPLTTADKIRNFIGGLFGIKQITKKVGANLNVKGNTLNLNTKINTQQGVVVQRTIQTPLITGHAVSSGSKTDACISGNKLIEYYCSGTVVKNQTYDCSGLCVTGAQTHAGSCTPKSGAEAQVAQGGDFIIVPTSFCSDTDPSDDPLVKGNITYSTYKWGFGSVPYQVPCDSPSGTCVVYDECSTNGNNVLQYSCESPTGGVALPESTPCSNGCVNGKCNSAPSYSGYSAWVSFPPSNYVFNSSHVVFACSTNSSTPLVEMQVYTTLNGALVMLAKNSTPSYSNSTVKVYSFASGKKSGFGDTSWGTYGQGGEVTPNVIYPDGIYQMKCVGKLSSTTINSTERAFYIAKSNATLIYNGGMIGERVFVENGNLSFSVYPTFDNYFTLIVGGKLINDKSSIVYSAVSPDLNVNFLSRTSIDLTTKVAYWNGITNITFNATSNGSSSVEMKALKVTVQPFNFPPIQANSTVQWALGQSTVIDLNNFFYDPDGGYVFYNWSGAENITLQVINNHTLNLSGSPSNFIGQRNLSINASDGFNAPLQGVLYLTISASNHNPTINSYSPIENITNVDVNEPEFYSINASDLDGDPLQLTWTATKSGNSSNLKTGYGSSFNFSSSSSGAYTIVIWVSDGLNSISRSWSLIVGSTTDTCGNGKIDSGEVCDGALLNDATCKTQGFDSGELSCSSNCKTYDKTLCIMTTTNEEPPAEPTTTTEPSKLGAILIWVLIGVLVILIIVGAILIIRIVKKRNAAKASQTWQSRPSGGSAFPTR